MVNSVSYIKNRDLLQLSKAVSQFTVGAEGNVSKRVDKGFVIKASGCSLKSLKASDLVTCKLDGTQLDNFRRRPSMEVFFHSWIYDTFDVNYIAHTHPVNVLKILCSNKIKAFSTIRLFPDQVVYNGPEYCYVPYAHPGVDLLKKLQTRVESFVVDKGHFPNTILLQNHGIICCGKTAKECVFLSEICDKSAEVFAAVGMSDATCTSLTEKSIQKILKDEREHYRKDLTR